MGQIKMPTHRNNMEKLNKYCTSLPLTHRVRRNGLLPSVRDRLLYYELYPLEGEYYYGCMITSPEFMNWFAQNYSALLNEEQLISSAKILYPHSLIIPCNFSVLYRGFYITWDCDLLAEDISKEKLFYTWVYPDMDSFFQYEEE